MLADIGALERCNNGGVFRSSSIGIAVARHILDLPEPRNINDVNGPTPYFIVGDEAFPFLKNLMRPYPGRGKSNLPKDEGTFNFRYIYLK